MQGKTITEINVGEMASFTKTVTEADICSFAGVTGDMNPVHINSEYARNTIFGKRIAHGILSVGFISNVLGTQLPGPGAIYISQKCNFLKAVFIGDTIKATVKVLETDVIKNRVTLRTYCTNQDGQLVVDGEAVLMPQKDTGKSLLGQETEKQVQLKR